MQGWQREIIVVLQAAVAAGKPARQIR